ncbi:MAG: glycosyltransferase [Caudoviricetes sp.]|nr:MAG: glycosyltransferase [Caudoviricetes sp.]
MWRPVLISGTWVRLRRLLQCVIAGQLFRNTLQCTMLYSSQRISLRIHHDPNSTHHIPQCQQPNYDNPTSRKPSPTIRVRTTHTGGCHANH